MRRGCFKDRGKAWSLWGLETPGPLGRGVVLELWGPGVFRAWSLWALLNEKQKQKVEDIAAPVEEKAECG